MTESCLYCKHLRVNPDYVWEGTCHDPSKVIYYTTQAKKDKRSIPPRVGLANTCSNFDRRKN